VDNPELLDASPTVISVIISIASVIASLIAFTWRSRGLLESIEAKIKDGDNATREHLRTDNDQTLSRYGETAAAIRNKINEVEIWNRDNFVRRHDFSAVIDGINRSIENLRAEMGASIGAMRTEMTAGIKDIGSKLDRIRDSQT
jgi:hypothetical protein